MYLLYSHFLVQIKEFKSYIPEGVELQLCPGQKISKSFMQSKCCTGCKGKSCELNSEIVHRMYTSFNQSNSKFFYVSTDFNLPFNKCMCAPSHYSNHNARTCCRTFRDKRARNSRSCMH